MKNVIKIVGTLGKKPVEGFNINQLARTAKIGVATVHRTLKEMEKNIEVLKSRVGNNLFYRLNLRNINTTKYFELAIIKQRKEFIKKKPEVYTKVVPLLDKAEIGIVFGSTARIEPNARDIDLLIISYRLKELKLMEKLVSGTIISPVYMKSSEFVKKLRSKELLILEIIKDGIILKNESKYITLLEEAMK